MNLTAADLQSPEMKALIAEETMPQKKALPAELSQMGKTASRVNQLKDEYRTIVSMAMRLVPGMQSGTSNKKLLDSAAESSKFFDSILTGATEDMIGSKRMVNTGIDEVFGTDRASQDIQDLQDLQSAFDNDPENGLSEQIGRFIGKYAVYATPAGRGLGTAAAGTFGIRALANPVTKFVLNYAPTGAAMGMATANPDQSLTNAAAWGAGGNMALQPVGKLIEKVAVPAIKTSWKAGTKLMPSGYAKQLAKETKVSSADIAKAAEASPNGAMVGSTLELPNVNKLEVNTLPALPGDMGKGVRDKMANIATGLMQQAQGIFNGVTNGLGRLSNGQELQKKVTDYFFGILQPQKQIMYDVFDQLAKQLNVDVPLTQYKKTLQSLIDKYSKGRNQLGRSTNDALIKELQDMLDNSADVASTDIANIFKGEFRKDAASTDNMAYKDAYKQLGEALHRDLKTAIDESGSAALKNSYEAAESYYAENIAPFLEGDLKKVINGDIDTDLIAKRFLPADERPTVLSNIVENVPGVEKNLLNEFMKDTQVMNKFGDSITNPQAIYSQLLKLGDDRINMTVKDPAMRQQISDFMANMRINGEVLTRMFNPKTGYANVTQEALINSAEFASSLVDDLVSGNKSGIATKLYGIGAGKRANELLSDPEALKKLALLRAQYENLGNQTSILNARMAIDPMRRLAVMMATNIGGNVY